MSISRAGSRRQSLNATRSGGRHHKRDPDEDDDDLEPEIDPRGRTFFELVPLSPIAALVASIIFWALLTPLFPHVPMPLTHLGSMTRLDNKGSKTCPDVDSSQLILIPRSAAVANLNAPEEGDWEVPCGRAVRVWPFYNDKESDTQKAKSEANVIGYIAGECGTKECKTAKDIAMSEPLMEQLLNSAPPEYFEKNSLKRSPFPDVAPIVWVFQSEVKTLI